MSRALRAAKDLLVDGAPPATTGELARWIGRSDDFIRTEITLGVIKDFRREQRGKRAFLVPRVEAIRYLQQMGVL